MATAQSPRDRRGEYRDPPDVSPVTPDEDARTILINRISWGAVLAGVTLAIITQVLLNMVGVGIGAGVVDPTSADGAPEASSVSIGAATWWAVSGILAAFAGGLAAGRLCGKPDSVTAGWHGLVTWAATTIVMLWLLTTTVSAVVGGSFQVLGNLGGQAAQGATQAVGATVSSIEPMSVIESRIRASGNDPQALMNAAVAEIRALLLSPQDQAAQQRERAVQALARAQNIPVQDAQNQIAQYEQQYRQFASQARQTATQAAGTASRAISWSAILAAIALALGALAGWFGGQIGTVNPTITSSRLMGSFVRPNQNP